MNKTHFSKPIFINNIGEREQVGQAAICGVAFGARHLNLTNAITRTNCSDCINKIEGDIKKGFISDRDFGSNLDALQHYLKLVTDAGSGNFPEEFVKEQTSRMSDYLQAHRYNRNFVAFLMATCLNLSIGDIQNG